MLVVISDYDICNFAKMKELNESEKKSHCPSYNLGVACMRICSSGLRHTPGRFVSELVSGQLYTSGCSRRVRTALRRSRPRELQIQQAVASRDDVPRWGRNSESRHVGDPLA